MLVHEILIDFLENNKAERGIVQYVFCEPSCIINCTPDYRVKKQGMLIHFYIHYLNIQPDRTLRQHSNLRTFVCPYCFLVHLE